MEEKRFTRAHDWGGPDTLREIPLHPGQEIFVVCMREPNDPVVINVELQADGIVNVRTPHEFTRIYPPTAKTS